MSLDKKVILAASFLIVSAAVIAAVVRFSASRATAPTVPVVKKTESPTADATSSTKKLVALTFDDGPYGTSTAQILDILKKENVRATFFVLGMNAERFPDQARRMVREGHVIGNHSYDHSKELPKMTAAAFEADVEKAERTIEAASGFHTTLFRPPYGALSETMRSVLKEDGYRNVLWNVDPEDWNNEKSPSDKIVASVLAAVKPGAVILMHDGRDTHVDYSRENTVRALPMVIQELKKRGYTFVTMDELR